MNVSQHLPIHPRHLDQGLGLFNEYVILPSFPIDPPFASTSMSPVLLAYPLATNRFQPDDLSSGTTRNTMPVLKSIFSLKVLRSSTIWVPLKQNSEPRLSRSISGVPFPPGMAAFT